MFVEYWGKFYANNIFRDNCGQNIQFQYLVFSNFALAKLVLVGRLGRRL